MPRPRTKANKGLPKHMRWRKGAYEYRPPKELRHLWGNQQTYRLGADLGKALIAVGERMPGSANVRLIKELVERYIRDIAPQKAKSTQRDDLICAGNIVAVFGHMPITTLRVRHGRQYLDRRSQKSPVRAIHEAKFLKKVMRQAVEWGYLDFDPLRDWRLPGIKSRDRYVTDGEVDALMDEANAPIRACSQLVLLTGLRQIDVLSLPEPDLDAPYLTVTPTKTKKKTGLTLDIEMTPALRAALGEALACRPVVSPHLFCARTGSPYVQDGMINGSWHSMVQRLKRKMRSQGKMSGERYTQHDLRAKVGTDIINSKGLAEAGRLLGHAEGSDVTQRVYNRTKRRVVTPTK